MSCLSYIAQTGFGQDSVLTVSGVSGDVIDDGDVTERSIDVVSREKTGGVDSVQDDQLQVVAGRREQPIL